MTAARPGRILLVEDDPGLLRLLTLRLRAFGHDVKAVESGAAALGSLKAFRPQVVVTDLRMEKMDGMQLLDELHRHQPSLPVIIITAHGTIPDAVNATQRGAFSFLTKPVVKEALQEQVDKALRVSTAVDAEQEFGAAIIARSSLIEDLLGQAQRIAQSGASVLITGDSGTGKELLARAIHDGSARREGQFIPINCGAMPDQLLESELFGYEKGAFTGATRPHAGLFEAADGGTLFLDEIGDMPLNLQMKLLRALQENEIRRVGSTRSRTVDVRVISATHRDLQKAISVNEFREDLFYRLNVVHLHIPPLAERREDIPPLAAHFLASFSDPVKIFAPEAMELLVAADWPGNVRQLYNVVEQNVILSSTRIISAHAVGKSLGANAAKLPSYAEARDEFTRGYLTELLQITNGNVTQAARMAQRNRTDFYKLLSRLDLDPSTFKSAG